MRPIIAHPVDRVGPARRPIAGDRKPAANHHYGHTSRRSHALRTRSVLVPIVVKPPTQGSRRYQSRAKHSSRPRPRAIAAASPAVCAVRSRAARIPRPGPATNTADTESKTAGGRSHRCSPPTCAPTPLCSSRGTHALHPLATSHSNKGADLERLRHDGVRSDCHPTRTHGPAAGRPCPAPRPHWTPFFPRPAATHAVNRGLEADAPLANGKPPVPVLVEFPTASSTLPP